MDIGKYALRGVKYFIKLVVLLGLIFAFMVWTGTANSGNGAAETIGGGRDLADFFATFFGSFRGRLFIAAIVVWCAVYPGVEFVSRHLNYDMESRRDAIIKAMEDGKMTLSVDESGKEGRMVFRGESPARRIWFLGDEAVTLTRNESGGFDAEGPRRFVMELQHRIARYV